MKLLPITLLLPLLLLVACSDHDGQANGVHFVQQKPSSECRYIDTVNTRWFVNPNDDEQTNQQKADQALIKQALAKGGNTLYPVEPATRAPVLSLRTTSKTAQVYHCP